MLKCIAVAMMFSLPLTATAQEDTKPTVELGLTKTAEGEVILTRDEAEAMSTDAFMDSHLDIKYLLIGRQRLLSGDYPGALYALDRSGSHGDKLAQAMLAEMHWEGKGTKVDRVRAYALADIASERLNDPFLVGIRERYWEALTEAERAQVPGIAKEIVDRYGEVNTNRRVQQHWRNSRDMRRPSGAGRLLGFIVLDNYSDGTSSEVRGDAFFAEKFWNLERYQEFKDKFVANASRYGTVKVRMGDQEQSSRVRADENAEDSNSN